MPRKWFGLLSARKKSKIDKQRETRKAYLERAGALKEKLRADAQGTQEEGGHFAEFAELVKGFFREMLEIRYQTTHQDLITELRKKRLKSEVKQPAIALLEKLTMMSYSAEKNAAPTMVEAALGEFIPLIDRLFEGMTGITLRPKEGSRAMALHPVELARDLSAGFSVLGRWGKGIAQAGRRILLPSRLHGPADAQSVMQELALAYQALEEHDEERAVKARGTIRKMMEDLSLEDLRVIEPEVKIFETELKDIVGEPRLKIQESSVPNPPRSAEPAETEEEEGEEEQPEPTRPRSTPKKKSPEHHTPPPEGLEPFIRLASSHHIGVPVIRRRLAERGWSEQEIEGALRKLSLA